MSVISVMFVNCDVGKLLVLWDYYMYMIKCKNEWFFNYVYYFCYGISVENFIGSKLY